MYPFKIKKKTYHRVVQMDMAIKTKKKMNLKNMYSFKENSPTFLNHPFSCFDILS